MAYSSPNFKQNNGVGYFVHFPRTHCKPYGKIDEPINEQDLDTWLKPINNEWLLRPKIATVHRKCPIRHVLLLILRKADLNGYFRRKCADFERKNVVSTIHSMSI